MPQRMACVSTQKKSTEQKKRRRVGRAEKARWCAAHRFEKEEEVGKEWNECRRG